MHSFDPKDWLGFGGGDADRRRRHPGDPDLDRALLCALAAAACLCLASFAPPVLAPAVAAELLVLAALGSALEAVLRGEPPLTARLTAWDQAAALMAAALLLRLAFGVPPEATPEGLAPP